MGVAISMGVRRFHPKKPDCPALWLVTDPRIGDAALLAAVERLPRGAGILFRHYQVAPAERRSLFRRVAKIVRRRGLILSLAGTAAQAQCWGADGWHGPAGRPLRPMLHSMAVHNLQQLRVAERACADLIFLSPLHPTRSHSGASSLGHVRFAGLAHQTGLAVIALGGMNAARARTLPTLGAYGWAAIDGLSAAT